MSKTLKIKTCFSVNYFINKSIILLIIREQGMFFETCVDHSYEPASGFREEFEAAMSLIKFSKLEFC